MIFSGYPVELRKILWKKVEKATFSFQPILGMPQLHTN